MGLLAETAHRFDELVARAQAGGRAPSVIAVVVRAGVVVHLTAAGDLPVPTADTQYRIGSISKTFTAALVMQLRDEGRLALDDLLYRHVPGTPLGSVTLRQLLGHVSGLQREPDGEWWERNTGSGLDAFLAKLAADKVAFGPHQTHHYSNLGFGLLGAVLERVSGQDWSSLLQARLLGPLGLRRTTYHPQPPFATGYVVHPWHETLREEPRLDAGAMAPAGQLWSTVEDLARWAGFLAAPDPAVLSPATLTEMCAPVVMSDVDGWTAGQGLGINLWRRGERVYVGHTGSMPGYLASLAAHRPSGTGVVAFANAYSLTGTDIGSLGLDLMDTVLDREPVDIAPWRPGEEPSPEAAALCGRWWWMGREYSARWKADELVMSSVGQPAMTPWRFGLEGKDRWRCRSGANDGELLTVLRDTAGAVVGLDIATFRFSRAPGHD